MQHWLQIATRNWRARPGRAALATLAVALGVGVVAWVTCCYESVQRSVTHVVLEWIGRSHVIIEATEGVWAFFGEDVDSIAAQVPGVKATTVRTREYVYAAPPDRATGRAPSDDQFIRIEVTGVAPEKELTFRTYKLAAGRFLDPAARGEILVEKLIADEFKLGLGDTIFLRDNDPPGPPTAFKIVGLIDRRRASLNQAVMTWAALKDVQSLCTLPGKIKGVDIMLHDASLENIRATADVIRSRLVEREKKLKAAAGANGTVESLEVKTTEAQHQRLGAARGLLQFIMMLLGCVVLLTALFIILASMGMGVTEQITELGLLRCVGVTRMQAALLVLCQTLPIGLIGTLVGLPLGLALQWITVQIASDYLGQMAISGWGLALAVAGGLGATVLGGAVPAVGAFLVSPVDATRPHATSAPQRLLVISSVLGAALIAAHELIKARIPTDAGDAPGAFDAMALASIMTLYAGFAFLAPICVALVGRLFVRVAALALRLRPQLLGEEIDKAPIRSAAVCCGLMVGLSLIVGLVVWARSVKAGWEFPKEFPDALLYSYDSLPLDEVRGLATMPGITKFTVADDFAFTFTKPSRLSIFRAMQQMDPSQRCLAIEPEEGFQIVKLTFLEGNEADALQKLNAGGHALVTREFAQARRKHLGDSITIWVDETRATFKIAGVIASPGLDIAISFFNASEYFQFYAVGAMILTQADAQAKFGRRYGKLMLFNFDFAANDPSRVAGGTPAVVRQSDVKLGARPNFSLGPGPIPGDGPEERIVNQMLERLGYPSKAFVTARELKQQIDRNIDRVTLLLSAIPFVGLVVAALGLANLMAANVASRSRQIAVLRSLGTTRSQVMRIVIGEAMVLGLLGSAMGLALGMLLGRTSNHMTYLLSGFQPPFHIPWTLVAASAALSTVLCLLAALVPARRASRSNVVAVLSSL